MPIKLANSPVSWGVDYADDPRNPPWRTVISETAKAGYHHTELGPYGYYPTNPDDLRAELKKHQLTIVGGFIFQPLHDPEKSDAVLNEASRTLKLLSAVGGTKLVTIDKISPARTATAGRSDLAIRLDAPRFKHMVDLINRVADLALAQGITPVIHQHVGSFIEFEDELEKLLQHLDPARVAICLDTGHTSYAGIDPIAFFKRHSKRIKYFHFKDIDRDIHARALKENLSFIEAIEQRIFCPMGAGVVDWKKLASTLKDANYNDTATVEQDIDPTTSQSALVDARESLRYLNSVGF